MDHLLSERVRAIMEDLKYSPSAFADTIDVPRPIISHILSGRNKPSLDVIQKILLRFPELNPWWLLTGTGEMKQLNLFSDEELESISVKSTEVQQSNSSSQAIKIPGNSSNESGAKKDRALIPDLPTELPPLQQPEAATPPTPVATGAYSKGKTIEKMIVFYSDKTFSIYHPE